MDFILKAGYCPFCGCRLPNDHMTVMIHLSNQTVMPQPVCNDDFNKLGTIEAQEKLLAAIRDYWKREIDEGTERTFEQKEAIKRTIDALHVVIPN